MKLLLFFAGIVLLACTSPAMATVCVNSRGVATDISYDLTNVFTTANNAVGNIVTLSEKSGYVGVSAICPVGTTGYTTKRSYVTALPVRETIDGFQYLTLNDYLEGAMSITDDAAGQFFPPANYVQMGGDANVPVHNAFGVKDSHLIFRLKVTRRFINMVNIPKQTMFTVYVTTTSADPLTTPVYTISYSGQVNVPQTCELNVGQIVEFDFGNINAALFSQAGAGNMPAGVNKQSKTVAIKCTNVESQAYLSLRIEAEKSSGNMMVSDNPDLGFVIADSNNVPLMPGNIASKINFRLDDNAAALVNITAWPVSVTGNKPSEGPFTARGYLRVDYD